MNVQSVEGDSVVLEIPSDVQPGNQESGTTGQADTPLILTIKFRLDGGTRPVFAGAKVRAFRPCVKTEDCSLLHDWKFRITCITIDGSFSSGTQVSLDSLNIEDLVSEAVSNEDVVGFVLQVKRRFRNQRSLITEVEELQTK